ncbi:MAG: TIGR04086 family membrane protein [Lachnospiraceae bacterium]|nr:TIGR04086 family membrane protein [Lachnospiraceae bacterium]
MQKNNIIQKLMWILKAMLASYIVTGLLLLTLTFLLYQFKLDEQTVMAGIVVIYVVSTFIGGLILGKLTKKRKFLWGSILGGLYFLLLFVISYGIYREFNTNGLNAITTALLCVGGGMLGGMVS